MAILFDVSFRLDDKAMKPKLEAIRQDIQNVFAIDAKKGGLSKELSAATNQAKILESALARATSEKGTSFMTLNSELHKSGTTAAQLTATLAAGGDRFHASLLEANRTLALSNRYSTVLGDRLKEAARVITQSFKYSTAQMLFRFITTQIRNTIQWAKDLESEINKIQTVTGKTAEEMDRITESTIKAAKELKIAAKDYAEASFIYYQQGLGDEEVQRRTEITIKASKAANQSVEEMSKQLTAIWNTYQMQGEEQARAASVGAKLAATTAIEFKDIAEAMQLSASAASTMGVSYDSLASIIATVGSTTKQSASIIGTAYKTIFSRFEQLKVEGSDGEVTLNTVSQNLKDLGINVLDQVGNLRELDDVINEVGNNWDNYTKKQQIAIAETVGGTRQYTQFLALMNNFDMYQKNLRTAKSESGAETLQKQYETALDSISSRATKMKESWSRAFHEVLDEDTLKRAYGLLDGMGQLIEGALKAVGGLPGILLIVGTMLSTKIGPAFERMRLDVQEMWTASMTLSPEKRQGQVKEKLAKEESARDAALVSKDAELASRSTVLGKIDLSKERESLNIEMQKSRVITDIKLANQNIDYQLKTAIGQQKIELQGKKEFLALLEEEYARLMDIASAASVAASQGDLPVKNAYRKYQGIVDNYNDTTDGNGNIVEGRGTQLSKEIANKKTELDKATKTGDAYLVEKLTAEYNALRAALDEAAKSAREAQNALDVLNNTEIGEGKKVISGMKSQQEASEQYAAELEKLIKAKKEIIRLQAEENAKGAAGSKSLEITAQNEKMQSSVRAIARSGGFQFTDANMKKIDAYSGTKEASTAYATLQNQYGITFGGKDKQTMYGLTGLNPNELVQVEELVRQILDSAGRLTQEEAKTGKEFANAEEKAAALAQRIKEAEKEAARLAGTKYTVSFDEKLTQLASNREQIVNQENENAAAKNVAYARLARITGKEGASDSDIYAAATDEQALTDRLQNTLKMSSEDVAKYKNEVTQLVEKINELNKAEADYLKEKGEIDKETKKVKVTQDYVAALEQVLKAKKDINSLNEFGANPQNAEEEKALRHTQAQGLGKFSRTLAQQSGNKKLLSGSSELTSFLKSEGLTTTVKGKDATFTGDGAINMKALGKIANDDQVNRLLEILTNIAKTEGLITKEAQEAGDAVSKNIGGAAQKIDQAKQQTPTPPRKGNEDPQQTSNFKYSTQDVKDFTQGMMSLTMAVTTTMNALKNLFSVLTSGNATFGEVTGAVLGLATSVLMVLPQIINGYEALTKSKIADNIATALNTKLTQGNTTSKLKSAIASKILKVANDKLKLSMDGALALIAVIVIAVTLLIKLIAALVKHLKGISVKGQMETARDSAKQLGQELEETTKKADELRQSMESYTSAKEKLDACTEGTKDFKEALKESNEAAKNVLETLSGIKGLDISNLYEMDPITKQITLNEEEVENAQKQLDSQVKKAELAESFGNVNATEKSLDYALSQAGYTAAGTGSDYNLHSGQGTTIKNNISKLAGLSGEELAKELMGLGIYVDSTSEGFKKLEDIITSFGMATQNAEEMLDISMKEAVGDEYENMSEERQALLSNQIKDKQDSIYNEYLTKGKGQLEAGLTDAKGEKYTLDNRTGHGINRRFDVYNSKGEKVMEQATVQTIASIISAKKAFDGLKDTVDGVNNVFDELQKEGREIEFAGASNYLTQGNLNNLSPMQLAQLKEKGANLEENPELKAVFETQQAFNDAITAANHAIENGAAGMVGAVQDAYNNAFLVKNAEGNYEVDTNSEISADQTKAIANMMETAFGNGGQALLNTFSDFVAGLDEEGLQSFIDTYGQINWANPDVGLLRVMLEKLGKSEEEAAEMASKLAQALYQQKEVTFESAQATYQSLHKIRQNLDDYSVVSDEDYKALEAAGLNISDYFTTMADGTHMLTGDAKELKSMIDGISFADYEQLADEQQGYADSLAKGINYSDETLRSASNSATVQEVQLAALSYNGMDAAHIEEIKGDAEAIAKAMEEAAISSETVQNMYKEAAENAIKAKEALETAQFQTRVEDSGLDFGETENYAKRLADAYGLTTQQARDLAIQNSRLDKGINDLNDDIEDFKKALADTNKNSLEWSKTMDKLKGELADIFNIGDANMLSDATAQEILNSEELVKALDGDTEALDKLRGKVTEDVGNSILARLKEEADELEWQSENAAESVRESFADQFAKANQGILDFETNWQILQGYLANGLNVDSTSFEEAMNGMIAAGHMTYEEITSLLGSMGVSAKVHTSYENKETHQIPIIKEVKEMTNFVQGDGDTPSRYETRTWSYVDGYTEVEEAIPSYSIEMESGDTVSGGEINSVGSSSANIGSKAKISQGSTTSGKASGGSSKKQKPVDNHKRYDNIQHSIDNMTRSAERYRSAADDAWGMKKIANLEAYAKKLQAVGKEYNKLYQEARSYYATDSAALNGSLANIGMSAQYNSDGTVANSEEIQKAWDSWANARLGDDDAQDYAKEQLELLDKVNESAEKANEAFDQAIENVRNYVSARLEAIQYKIDFKINISEAEIKEIELLIDCMGELGTASGKALKEMKKVFEEQKKEVKASIEGSQEAVAFLNDLSNPANQAKFKATFGDEIWEKYLNGNGGMPAEVMDFLEDQRSSMVDQLSALLQTSRDMFQNYLDAIQLYMDEFDRITTKIDTQNAQLEMYTKILEVSGKAYTKEGREARQQIAKQTVDNNLTSVKASQAKVDMLQQQFDDAQKRLDDFTKKYGDPENYDAATAAMYNNLKNSVNDLTDMLESAKQDAISSINTTLDSIYESIATGAEAITDELMDELDGIATTLGGLSEIYQAQYDVSHFYLDDYDKNYNLNKLEHDITQQIKDVQDPSRLEAYNKMLDDINAKREEGVQLTQKDVDVLNAEFELQKLYDEYEKAKNAKNSMRLSRDASGNYSYVYSNTSGDEEEIEQKIKDQLYNIKKLHEEAADEMQSMWVQNQEEWIEYEKNVDQLRYETDEKYALEVEFRRQIFQERSRQFAQACSEHLAAYDAKFEESALGVATQCASMENAEELYKNKHAEYFEKLKENTLQYKTTVEEVCNRVDLDYKNLATDVSAQTDKMKGANDALSAKIKELESTSSTSLNGMSQDLTAFADTFVSEFGEMMAAVQDLIDTIKEFEQTAASASNVDMSSLSNTASSIISGYSGGSGGGTGGGTGGSTGSGGKDATALQQMLKDCFGYNLDVDGVYGPATKSAVMGLQKAVGVSADGLYGSATVAATKTHLNKIYQEHLRTTDPDRNNQWIIQNKYARGEIPIPSAIYKTGGIADFTGPAWLDGTPTQPELVLNAEDTQNMLKAVEIIREVKETSPEQSAGALDKIKKFDTGGYTGDWGTSDGKLAVLHQKEMVLNATDTEHILQAVKMVRAVVESQSNVLRTENISVAQTPVTNNVTQPVAQDVKIEASFPNVSVAAEIEEALNNIVNEAVQYVSQK